MKKLKRLKITFVIPILIFMSIMFMATHCADYNPDMLFKLIGDVPEKVYNCVEDTCEITIEFETDRALDTLLIKYGEEQGFEQIDFEEGEESTYQVSITLERGINNITLKGESSLSFSELSFTIECVCPEEGAPEISWDPDKPPTDTTTEGTAKLNITSDKELDTLKVTTNGQEQVIQNPQAEQDGEMYNYETTVELQDGDNEIEIQGENAVGPSNLLQHNIEKGKPPVIEFAEQPPAQVTNCVEDECQVTITISCEDDLDEITTQVGEGDPYSMTDFQSYANGNVPIPVTLQKGTNIITITAKNRFGTSNTLTCTIECVCEELSSPTIHLDPDLPPTTTFDTIEIKITADQVMEAFKMWNNGLGPDVIESPVYDEETDEGYLYSVDRSISEGGNELSFVGINENGESNQVEHNIERGRVPWIEFDPEPPTEVSNCENDECTYILKIYDYAGSINDAWKMTNLFHQVGSGGDLIENSVVPDAENNYSITVTLQKGHNVITITAFNRFGSDSLTCTIECVCEEEASPTISFDPEKPPTDTTTQGTAKLNIKSSQLLEILRVWNNEQQIQVIENPENVGEGGSVEYETSVPVEDGINNLEVQGENANGLSNKLEHTVEKGQPPVIAFAQQPPSQVTNCENDECEVTIYISCENGSNQITYQVGDEVAVSLLTADLMTDAQGNYPIPVTLQKGTNVITFTSNNRFGTSNTLTCTIECVCETPSSGYTKEQLIGETDIPKPTGIDFQPDYTNQKNEIVAVTKNAEEETEIKKGDLDGGNFENKYPGKPLPPNVVAVAHDSHDKKDLLMTEDKLTGVDEAGNLETVKTFPEGQTGQPGQLRYQPDGTGFMTADDQGNFFLNFGALVCSFINKVVGVQIMSQASNNPKLVERTPMVETVNNPSGSRAIEQNVFAFNRNTQTKEQLFQIPLSHGSVIDIIHDVMDDYETVHFIVTTVKNETEYWVNIYNQAGERLHAFMTHDLSDLAETSGDTIFYKVIKATQWPDDKLYIMHSEFPGIQVWAPEE